MALENTTFVTVAEVKSHIDETGTTWDTIIESLINQCTQFAMNYCGGRRFIAPTTDETEYYDGNPERTKLFLRSFPIKSITGIYYRTGPYDSPSWVLLNPAYDYIRDDRKGILAFASLPVGTQNIKAVYKGGYDTSSNVPSDLKLAVIKEVAKEFNKRKSQGISQEDIGGGKIVWEPASDFRALLDNYRVFL